MELNMLGLLLLLVPAIFFDPVNGYKNGKVTESCRSMKPGHGHPSQPFPSPYTVTVDKSKFSTGDQIKVTLSGSSTFKGFLIQARDTADLSGDAIGSFTLVDHSVSQLLNCGEIKGSAVSHTSKSGKLKVEVVWNVPSNAPPAVQFFATVLQHYDTYWVKMPGPIISMGNSTPIPTQAITTVEPTTESPALRKPFSSKDCGSTKSCLRDPIGCDPETDPKCYFLSFTSDEHSVLFELSGPTEGYVSFALSHDKWMGNDDVYLCVRTDDYVNINPAYVTGRTHPTLDSQDTLTNMAWRLSDGVIQCMFRREIRVPADQDRFNLDKSYYIFLADGKAEHGMVHKHHRQPLISSEKKYITSSTENLNGSRSPFIIKVHGALMLVAWMTTVSIGVIVARFLKPLWPESTLFGQKIWFQVHRTLMSSTVLLTCIAFILPFVYRGGWSKHAGAHPFLGCTVMALAVLQLVMAIFRPHPNTPRRLIFNWTHWGTGTISRIIAVAAVFLGMDLPALDLPDPWDTILLSGFVTWHILTELLLELHNLFIIRKAKNVKDDEVEIIDSALGETEGHMIKKIVLTVYICGNAAFLSAFLAAINYI
ncbi:putative ferric-chelate reductase 1 [Polyodon spathula]|uniref:putative ferric-chelate reductase 1 n=1 Tax=Polyodon spathula TaxID=7913 RepID=UPI001B7DE0C6|nr:putative ferric-chelate reductase 1 [Polyodon spathula]XP_041126580.1 putative ferric-chelate reductase 1 [Polyodon spathula]XP_041126581.1 putative ferric-chelate reductase 1 [Polyodon spathula]